MSISWGAWEYSGGNGMRVGIDVSWEAIGHNELVATATVKYYTENEHSYNDGQTLNYSGALGGSHNFQNSSGGGAVLRQTRTYDYTYPSNSYGSSPGNRTFTVSLSGAYNGVTPSKSVTTAIPARPYDSPLAPTNVNVSRISDSTQKVTYTNRDTAGEPWDSVRLQRDINDNNVWWTVASGGGGSTSVSDGSTDPNQKMRYRVRAENSVGNSAYVETSLIFTTPLPPGGASRTPGAGSSQDVSWSNKLGYTEYSTEIQRGVTSGGSTTWTTIATVGSGVTSYNDAGASAAQRTKYRVRHKTTTGAQGTLYSTYSNETTETPGVTSPPGLPKSLTPSDGATADPTAAIRLSWEFISTDTSTQTESQVRHRVVGAGVWTTESIVVSSNEYWDLPANTYANGQQIEWQVATKGADPTWGPWSDTAMFLAFASKIIVVERDIGPGLDQLDLSGYDWVYPTLLNNWVPYGGVFVPPRYCRRGGVVYIQGLAKSGTVNSIIFNLGQGFRPSGQLIFGAPSNGFNTGPASAGTAHTHIINQQAGRIDVFANGDVMQGGAASTAWVSLSIPPFPADQ